MAPDAGDQGGVTLGVKAADASAARQQFAPFIGLLTKQLGRPVTLRVCGSSADLAQECKTGDVAFLLASPTDYVALNRSAGVTAIATKRNKGGTPYCQGILVAAKGNGITRVEDLKGKRFRFGPKGSFNKYHAALCALAEAGLDPKNDLAEVSYGSGCGGIAETIGQGQADAGVVCDYSWDGWVAKNSPEIAKLVVIGRGPKLRDTAVAAARNVDPAIREDFLEALLTLDGNPALLAPPLKAKGFAPATDRDYDPLRKILEDQKQ